LATLDAQVCVISSYRCRRGARDASHARIRLGKVAVHELGHTFGIPHCPAKGCLMRDGHGSVTTVDTEYELCPETRQRVLAAGVGLSTSAPPWPVVQ
jgi:archaemetzincin